MDELLKQWNETYFDGRCSPTVLDILDGLAISTQSETVRRTWEIQLKLMKRARIQAIDFSDDSARAWYLTPRMVPDAWTGMPAPFTFSGRHVKLDVYITCNRWRQFPSGGKFLDVGCGFPPVTTVETAEKLPNWRILGADPAIPYYIVYDELGDHATFSQTGEFLYFQAQNQGRNQTFLKNSEATEIRFNRLFQTLLTKHSEPDATAAAGSTGARLISNPVEVYESENLSFLSGGIGEIDVHEQDFVRCFNVLMYFDRSFRNKALSWFAEILSEGGLLMCGCNNFHHSLTSRYTVYKREQERLVAREFAFSVDNLRAPIPRLSWLALHEDDIEANTQAIVVGLIRSNTAFQRDFDTRLDALLAEYELFKRDENGYLNSWGTEMPADQFERLAQINDLLEQEGYVEGAVAALKHAGYDARRNCIGHISVDPGQFEV